MKIWRVMHVSLLLFIGCSLLGSVQLYAEDSVLRQLLKVEETRSLISNAEVTYSRTRKRIYSSFQKTGVMQVRVKRIHADTQRALSKGREFFSCWKD